MGQNDHQHLVGGKGKERKVGSELLSSLPMNVHGPHVRANVHELNTLLMRLHGMTGRV